MLYKTILFDLDGTLTDPGIGITNSVNYALKKMNYPEQSRNELFKFIGPPLIDSFMQFCNMDKAQAEQAVNFYREYYAQKGIFENYVYEKIPELLETLQKMGKTLIVASSKPEIFCKQIMEKFDLAKYFLYIAGANMDETRTKKAEVIEYALKTCNISNYNEVLMVGDRMHDVLGAKQFGIATCAVLFGYGTKEELKNAGAKYFAKTALEILNYAKL